MIEVKVPELAESITEGTVANWLKKVGDVVREGEAVAELETDKVNIEVNAEGEGVLHEILKQVGDTVQVGEVIALLNEEAAEGGVREVKNLPPAAKNKPVNSRKNRRRSNRRKNKRREKATPLSLLPPLRENGQGSGAST